jgi:cellobiose-specific phosphotransferase system component IIA
VKPFVFRAQAAIDLRQREYDEARRVLARASLDLRAAHDVASESRGGN